MNMKRLVFLLMLVSTSVFGQVEQGVLIGGGIGFPMQDKQNIVPPSEELQFDHNLKGNGSVGYRFRFLPAQKSFYDLDLTVGFQGMSTRKGSPFYSNEKGAGYVNGEDNKFSEFIMPISIAGSWNYRLTDKFHVGLGIAPTFYVQPKAAFDLGVLAKAGYRVSNHCELSLSYQYGCLNTLKHFNDGASLGRKGHLSDLMFSVYVPFRIK